MAEPLKLFDIARRGVNVVSAPTDMGLEEVRSAQNAEVVSDKGEGALDQRPGMVRVNSSALTGSILLAHDVPADVLVVKTPLLYAGMHSSAIAAWRFSADGTTWSSVPVPTKPFCANASIAGYFKNIPKCATVGKKMYYVDGSVPINLRSWNGLEDSIVSTVPPSVSGTTLAAPTVYPTDAGGLRLGFNGASGATTYGYKFVAVSGASHSAVSAETTVAASFATLSSSNYLAVTALNPPPSGATTVDVYRTTGGLTQGKIGTIPVVAGVYTQQNGSGYIGYIFTDGGLVGDGTTAPASASGSAAGDALGVLDLITDGTDLYLAILDQATADPVVAGRVLKFAIGSNAWTQIGNAFPLASGNGGPAALASYDGALVFGTYIGTTAGNTSYLKSLATPLPAGGFPEVHTTAVSQATCSLAMFNGDLYAGYASLVAGTAAIVAKRTPVATWSTSLTGPATAQYNAFTSLGVFNGRLYAGWTSGGGATAANIKSTADGTTWTTEQTLGVGEVPGQMVVYNGALYIVCGKTGIAYNTTTRILKRDTAGTWTVADDPAEDFAGCLGIIYQ